MQRLARRVTVARDASVVGCDPVPRSWSILDFVLVWLGGTVASVVFVTLAGALELDQWVLVIGLLGHYTGVLFTFWLLTRFKDDPDVGLAVHGSDLFYMGLGLIGQLALGLLLLPLSNFLLPDGGPPQVVVDLFAEADTTAVKVALVTSAIVLTPITEELVYRGILLRALERWGKRFALVLSALIFAGVHIDGLDMDRLWQSAVVVLPPLFILGLVLGWITQRSGRLGPAIFLHSGWNLLTAFVLLIPEEVFDQVS